MLDTRAGGIVRFSVFEVDLRSGELRKRGLRVPLQQQPFRVLVRLLECPNELVTRDSLRHELWPTDTFVDFEQGLNAAVKRLREALGDSAQTPRFIETLPKRGYRFISAGNLAVAPSQTTATDTHQDNENLRTRREQPLQTTRPMESVDCAPLVHPLAKPRLDRQIRHQPPFVGRARELARLTAALSRAVAGQGTIIAITGDAGLGKTALLEAFLDAQQAAVPDALVCRGQSVEHSGAGEPYSPVIDALAPTVAFPAQGLHDIVYKYAPSWQSLFPAAYRRKSFATIPPTPARLARELGDALCSAARSRPLVMILEDLHWADPSTIELLRDLSHRAARAAILLIATCRQEEAATNGCSINQMLVELEARGLCDSIELRALDESATGEYLECRFGLAGEVLARLTSLLFNATEGHPLFLVSLVQLFIQRGDLRQRCEGWQLSTPLDGLLLVMPRTVEAVIKRKLRALEDKDRRLLRHASIEGHEFSTATLTALLGEDSATLEERLQALANGPRIVEILGPERYVDDTWGERYRFAHARYHSVVYAEVPPTRRASLHRHVGERLEALHPGGTTAIAAQLARHFKEGRDWRRAFDYFVQAGDNSTTMSAALEAEGHYTQAIQLASAEGTQIERRRIAVAYYKRAITRVVLGDSLVALTDYDQALIGASSVHDHDLTFDIRLAKAYTQVIAERIDEALQSAACLEKDLELTPNDSKRLRYLILDMQLKMNRGDLDQAALAGDRLISLARARDDPQRLCAALLVQAKFDYYRTDYEAAVARLREVCNSPEVGTRRQSDPRARFMRFDGILFLARTLADLGRITEALGLLRSELEIARADGYGYWVPILLNGLGWLFGEIGELDGALRHAEEAVARTVGQNTEVRLESRLIMTTASSRLGLLDRAAGLLHEAESVIEQGVPYQWLWRIHLGVIASEDALVRSAPMRAADLARQAAALGRCCGVWRQVVVAERLLAESAVADGDWFRAGAHAQAALDILAARPIPILAWKVHAVAARIHWHAGRHAEATEARDRARSEVRQLSDGIYDTKVRAVFLDSFDVREVVCGCGWD
jgi:DNA-binding winged helix-turn-helix (wHTH) protein/tetratricopeptide (TPR) repeat protein/type II secretory pathway predicted ATPase ExeA